MRNGRITEKSEYKVVISDLGMRPFHIIRLAFTLTSIIPLLVIFYVIIGRNFLYKLFLGHDGFLAAFAVFISLIGFLYSYNLTRGLVMKLLLYSADRKRADNEKTELLLAVSHDLKTPLMVLKIGLKSFVDTIETNLTALQTKTAQYCLNAVDKIVNFVNELLDVSKASYAHSDTPYKKAVFGALVKKEIDDISNIIANKKLTVDFEDTTGGVELWADEHRLGRAVMNIILNAVKYTPEGGNIVVRVTTGENYVKLVVANTGPGISPQAIDRVFNKFERLGKDSKIDGVGLGLYIVREIVELHKGHITVTSEPDKETEVAIVLPKDLRASETKAGS